MLQLQAKNSNSPLKGLERTVLYLQNLGNSDLKRKNTISGLIYVFAGDKHLDLIFKSAQWVLKEDSQEVLKVILNVMEKKRQLNAVIFQIFIEDMPEVENLPRDKVMEFLRRECPKLVTPYLVSLF